MLGCCGSLLRIVSNVQALSACRSFYVSTLPSATVKNLQPSFSRRCENMLSPSNILFQPERNTTRGMNFQPNTYKRIKKHGRQKMLSSVNGKITMIRRMMKGKPRRTLTH
uniref:Uncharacterized LOC100185340 n=1 Tax=Ciona intestinalis TaxID=7719 RepID=H2XNH6_CIOIN|nr:uncharacterized protein LOC100185340 [Ciona intestinalis]|eukprot:XP_018670407.1 uncharacterized protein LOC100185340 [Ciona intestinalis]